MVLQRDRANTLWGWTNPDAEVSVSLGGKSAKAKAGADGKWIVKITPPGVGGPYTVTIDGPKHIELTDVLVGDVWICGGQSNMEMGVAQVNNAAQEIANANFPNIRFATIPHNIQFEPASTIQTSWSTCSPETIAKGGWGGFSAVGYFFARELNRRLKVPIGLVQDCWGGTIVEAWISRPSVEKQGDFSGALAQIDQLRANGSTPFAQQVDNWLGRMDPGSKGDAHWEYPNLVDGNWKATTMPATYEANGFGAFDGVVWFRGTLELSVDVSGAATLFLGAIDDFDATWVNGVRVGSTFLFDAPRRYTIPAGTLKAGRNVIVVRAIDTGGPGGFMSPASDQFLQLADGRKVSLASATWKFAQGTSTNVRPPFPQPMSGNPNVPTVLHNGMISPILPLAIKGAIWYQGESNASRAYQYRELMPLLITDWRKQWGQGDFPFFIVQLANFTQRLPNPAESDWAELREAQAMTIAKVKNSGLATAIDIGDAADIHPKDKQNVGLRLAFSALHVAYGQTLAFSGPTYQAMKVEGNSIRITFNHTEGGLRVKGADLKGFAIAGKDKKFVWAEARIEGNAVVVSSPLITLPVAVRYGWANNPEVTLYNGAELPAIPFRTDDWPGVTFGKK